MYLNPTQNTPEIILFGDKYYLTVYDHLLGVAVVLSRYGVICHHFQTDHDIYMYATVTLPAGLIEHQA